MTQQLTVAADPRLDADWWRQAVVYQVYPRSFADSDGDGIGDIPGVTSRIPYLAGLGVDAIWLSPFYPSALADGGLRRRRLPRRPSAARDARRLRRPRRDRPRRRRPGDRRHRAEPHLRPASVVRRGTGGRAGLAGPGPLHLPRRHRSRRLRAAVGLDLPLRRSGVDPGARTDGEGGQWYCHLFAREQPDLNWDNREVRDDFLATLRFWADRGVDGFRVDVAHALAKDLAEPLRSKPTLEDEGVPLDGTDPLYDRDEVHEIYAEWRQVFDSYDPPRTAVAEANAPSERRALYARPTEPRPGLQLRSAQGRLLRRRVPRGDHVLPRRGGQDRLVVDLGAQQPRRRPARHPVCVAARTGPGRLADERRRVAGRRRGSRSAPGPCRRLVDAGPAGLVLPLPG